MTNDDAAAVRAKRFGRLPDQVDPATFVVEIPAIPDAREQPAPPAPAAAPELIAATQIANARQGAASRNAARGAASRE